MGQSKQVVVQNAWHKRNEIELVRVIAAFAVVWYHARGDGYLAAYGGLIVFLMLSPYLAEESGIRPSMFAQRVRRLLIPWLFWFAVYGARNLLSRHNFPIIRLDHGWIAGILAGPSIHLWYLPFIFCVLVIFDLVRPHTTQARRAACGGVGAAAVLATTGCWREWSLEVGEPITQYLHALSAVCLGFFFAGVKVLPRPVVLFIAVAIFLGVVVAMPYEGVGLAYAVGIAAFIPLLKTRLAGSSIEIGLLQEIASLTLGIYLVHPLFLGFLFGRVGVTPNVCGFMAFVLSVCSIWLFRRLLPGLARRVT